MAAGAGTRMKSPIPKVLHKVGGRTLLDRVIDTVQATGCEKIVVVVGADSAAVRELVARRLGEGAIAVQDPPLGTGHAVLAAKDALNGFQGARPEADGYPRSARCGGGDVEQIARAAQGKKKASFEYDRRSDKYGTLWKTDKKWAGTCRDFVLKLDDGSLHTARFEFSKKKR